MTRIIHRKSSILKLSVFKESFLRLLSAFSVMRFVAFLFTKLTSWFKVQTETPPQEIPCPHGHRGVNMTKQETPPKPEPPEPPPDEGSAAAEEVGPDGVKETLPRKNVAALLKAWFEPLLSRR